MRLREMRIGQKERSGNWRADYLETRTVGSEEGGWKRAARAVPRQPPILLAVSVRQMWPLRTPSHVSHALPIPQMSGRMRDAFTCSSSQGGNVHFAWDSHLHQTVDRLLSSVAPPPLRRLDKTGHHLSYPGDADRPCQKQVRTRGRKRTPTSATHCSSSTGETTRLYQNGPDAPGASGQDGSDLEASAFPSSARNAPPLASPGIQALLEIPVQSGFCQTKDLHRDRGLD